MRARAFIQPISAYRTRRLSTAALLVLFALFTACKTSPEAVSAANQLTAVSQQLTAYYTDLEQQVTDTITLNLIQAEVMPDQAVDPKQQSDIQAALIVTRQELAKRVAMAKAMGTLAAAYASLAGSKAAADIGTAASGMATACTSIGPLSSAESAAIPDIVHQAAQLLIDSIRERKLRQSSAAIGNVVGAIATLFQKEEHLYTSINDDHIKIAAQVARHLVMKEDVVDVNVSLAPALKPFDLAPSLPIAHLPDNYRRLNRELINARMTQQISDYAASTTALGNSLQAVSVQIAKVAGKHHPEARPPASGPGNQPGRQP
jgi:hypothetical protein